MARITIEDLGGKDQVEFDVTLGTPRLERMEKDGSATGMAIIIPGTTKDGKSIEHYIYANTKIQTAGRNKGRTNMEVAMDTCIELGMSEPFSPSKLDEIEGTEVVFVVGVDEYKGVKKAKVKFINTGRRPTIPKEQADAEWAAMFGGGAAVAAAAEPAQAAGDSSEVLPF